METLNSGVWSCWQKNQTFGDTSKKIFNNDGRELIETWCPWRRRSRQRIKLWNNDRHQDHPVWSPSLIIIFITIFNDVSLIKDYHHHLDQCLILVGDLENPVKTCCDGCDVPVRALYCFTTNKLFLEQTNNSTVLPQIDYWLTRKIWGTNKHILFWFGGNVGLFTVQYL